MDFFGFDGRFSLLLALLLPPNVLSLLRLFAIGKVGLFYCVLFRRLWPTMLLPPRVHCLVWQRNRDTIQDDPLGLVGYWFEEALPVRLEVFLCFVRSRGWKGTPGLAKPLRQGTG